jgi:pSer/pThr/pTyr-binding forkhead associated (FHA) protein
MPPQASALGIMKPLGGGDPVPLRKNEMIVGRRPSCDIRLDFENISGKHCVLRYTNQVWHVRDLGSTNGTSINGARLTSEHVVMPDDELGIAGHIFHIDYEPGAPESILKREQLLDEDEADGPKRHSLMELAGLDTDGDRRKRTKRPSKAPTVIERLSADQAEFDDALPAHVKAAPPPKPAAANDDDFLKLIEDDVIKPK